MCIRDRYQGVVGVVSTTIVGAVMMLIYVVTGTIVVPIVLHALFDLRSLVLIPMACLLYTSRCV